MTCNRNICNTSLAQGATHFKALKMPLRLELTHSLAAMFKDPSHRNGKTPVKESFKARASQFDQTKCYLCRAPATRRIAIRIGSSWPATTMRVMGNRAEFTLASPSLLLALQHSDARKIESPQVLVTMVSIIARAPPAIRTVTHHHSSRPSSRWGRRSSSWSPKLLTHLPSVSCCACKKALSPRVPLTCLLLYWMFRVKNCRRSLTATR